jgi:ankyrin repeat protein
MLLHDAVRDRNIAGYNGIDMLMEFGPPVDYLDDHNNTPLHRAVHAGYLAGVIEIKKAGNSYKCVPEEDLMVCHRVPRASCAKI